MMNRIKTSILTLAMLATSAMPALAAIPWAAGAGTGAPLQVSGATPTCTYTATALACIEDMTANVTSITLAGMTAGTYYSLILMQDGTGSRTLAQTSVTGAPALTTAEKAANGYAVWIIKATSASAATFVTDYSNAPLFNDWTTGAGIAGTAVAAAGTAITQAIPTVVIPGLGTSNTCSCNTQAITGTNVALHTRCVPATNAATCYWQNESAASVTATTATFNVRIAP
jgi:hypothetical protein